MGWVKLRLAGSAPVNGVIVARQIDERLRYAASIIPNISLLEYEVDFRLREATGVGSKPETAGSYDEMPPTKPAQALEPRR